jgi:hypothetical protein
MLWICVGLWVTFFGIVSASTIISFHYHHGLATELSNSAYGWLKTVLFHSVGINAVLAGLMLLVLIPEIREIGPVILVADVVVAAAVGWLFGAVGSYVRADFVV